MQSETRLVDQQWSDEQSTQGWSEGALEPCDPRAVDDHTHLRGQLEAQQVLGSCREEHGRAVHRALELGLHQKLAQLACRLCACTVE